MYIFTLPVFIMGGIYLALLRLDCWRLFVSDFLREVWRIKELNILNEVLESCCEHKKQKNEEGNSNRLRVLNFGGGKGKTTEHMLKHCTKHVEKVDAIDIEAFPPHVKKYDGQTIPFPPSSFDIAVAMYVFHHIPDTPSLIQQLKKGLSFVK